MKHIIRNIAFFIFKMINFLIDYGTVLKFRRFIGRFYSLWLRFYFKECSTSYFCRPVYIEGGKYIIIGDGFNSGPRFRLEAFDFADGEVFTPEIIIGENVSISWNCHIGAINKIIIKDNVLIGSNVLITDHSHGTSSKEDLHLPPAKRKLYSKGPVIIEENVWIGENASILPGVTIGRNSIIGANSVVTKDIPPDTVAVGNPIRIVKQYSSILLSNQEG